MARTLQWLLATVLVPGVLSCACAAGSGGPDASDEAFDASGDGPDAEGVDAGGIDAGDADAGGIDAGGADAGGADAGGPVTFDPGFAEPEQALCDSILEAHCRRAMRCGASSSFDSCMESRWPFNFRTCREQLVLGQRDGRLRIDASALGECLLEIAESAACWATVDGRPSVLEYLASCRRAIEGLVPSGGSCFQSNDCADTQYCEINYGYPCPGTCKDRIPLGVRAPSNLVGLTTCEHGLVKSLQGCQPYVAEGEACRTTTLETPRTCELGLRVDGLVCAQGGEAGDTCDGGWLWCRLGRSCINRTCVRDADLGEGCSGTRPCLPGLACDAATGTCQQGHDPGPKLLLGGACSTRDDCVSGLGCRNRVCSAGLPEGGNCTTDDDCAASCIRGRCTALGYCVDTTP